MLLQRLATTQWSSWLLAPTLALLAHALLALPPAVVASAPSWQLSAGLFIDVERWHALVVMLSLPWQSVVGLSSEPSLSRAWVRLWPRHKEGYRTVSVSYSLPDSQLLAALRTYLVVHDGHAEATRRGASGCWRGDAAATSGGGACACVWAV